MLQGCGSIFESSCTPNIDGFSTFVVVAIVIRERGSVLYLGMALECWDFAKLAIA